MTDILIIAGILSVIALWLTAVALVVVGEPSSTEVADQASTKQTSDSHQTMHAVDHVTHHTTGRGLWGRR